MDNFTDIEKATSATYKPAKPAGDDPGDDPGDVGMFLRADGDVHRRRG